MGIDEEAIAPSSINFYPVEYKNYTLEDSAVEKTDFKTMDWVWIPA
ncbi:hypothetical protein NG796_11115 [Laspinema sp. A4]|nr:hypothetical protein [Laspinema sp. D2d]MCT7983847.1 hypothetical protein [Laspinema sp. D2d]